MRAVRHEVYPLPGGGFAVTDLLTEFLTAGDERLATKACQALNARTEADRERRADVNTLIRRVRGFA